MTDELSASERRACIKLEVERQGTSSAEEADDLSNSENIVQDIINEREKINTSKSVNMNCDFILGSVAEIERLWSLAKNVLPSHRKSCTPVLTEALLFLKVNQGYWNLQLVCEAMDKLQPERVVTKLK